MNHRELATVLAALRLYQQARYCEEELVTVDGELADDIEEIATDCGRFPRLTDKEINTLCEGLNE